MISLRLPGPWLTHSRGQQPLSLKGCREETGKRGSFPERPCSLCQASSVSFSREARASLPRVTYLSPHSTPGPGSQQNSTEKMTQCVSSHTCVHTHTHTPFSSGRIRSCSLWLTSIYLRYPQMVSGPPPAHALTGRVSCS